MKRLPTVFAVAATWIAGPCLSSLNAADAVDFHQHIRPLLESACVSCHGPDKDKGDLRVHTKEATFAGGDSGPSLVAGKPDESLLYKLTVLDPDDDDIMPPKVALTKIQTDKLKQWIQDGAKWPDGVELKQVRRIDFVKDVQPILEYNCVACHRDDYAKGDFSMTTLKAAMTTGEYAPNLVPFDSEKSYLWKSMVLPADDDSLMPPTNKGGPLDAETTDTIKLWIEQGAHWPDGLKLEPKKKDQDTTGDDLDLVRRIHELIVAQQKEKTAADMKPYETRIPDSSVAYEMVPVPGGKFVIGSPAAEKGRKDDEGPQAELKISPFWMGKYEVTWNAFELFMYPNDRETQMASADPVIVAEKKLIHACSRPTKPYVEMSFGMGKDGFPAISMTQHAARKYCQWLSAKTGHFYRLPTEAEWEYACRAGSKTAFHFGDDPSKLGEYAWFEDNSDWKYQKVGTKKPNPWGLYDMHGNVAEWCLDQYSPESYKQFKTLADNPEIKADSLYPRVARGGSWDHPPEMLRSAARIPSHPDWKIQDPQLPKSIWYHTDAQFLGMRIVRPLEIPSPEEMFEYWNNGIERE